MAPHATTRLLEPSIPSNHMLMLGTGVTNSLHIRNVVTIAVTNRYLLMGRAPIATVFCLVSLLKLVLAGISAKRDTLV
jgi:hypothetical protein